jgi:hypothetical protein
LKSVVDGEKGEIIINHVPCPEDCIRESEDLETQSDRYEHRRGRRSFLGRGAKTPLLLAAFQFIDEDRVADGKNEKRKKQERGRRGSESKSMLSEKVLVILVHKATPSKP